MKLICYALFAVFIFLTAPYVTRRAAAVFSGGDDEPMYSGATPDSIFYEAYEAVTFSY